MFQHVLNSLSEDNKAPITTANPANESISNRLGPLRKTEVLIGTIIKVGVGTYDALVSTYLYPELECVCASTILPTFPYNLGGGNAVSYAEGSVVAVLVVSSEFGIILCAVPTALPTNQDILQEHRQLIPESGVNIHTERAYDTHNIMVADNIRPIDLVPGDITWLNEMLIGIGVLKLTTFMQASDRAKLEMFMLDDAVRLTSGHFQHSSSALLHNIYNDNGFNTSEFIGSSHQCEMFGRPTYKAPILANDEADMATNTNTNIKHAGDVPDPYIMGRYHFYLGHMGSMFSFFIANPQLLDEQGEVKVTDEVVDEGLFHTNIDGAGRLLVRSAGGICFQRTDKIAVPKKIAQPWYTGEGPGDITEKLPFEWDTAHPYARHLQLRDAFAWYTKSAYQRFLDNNKNYYVPEDKDLKTPTDTYDNVGEGNLGTDKFSDKLHADATSYFHMGEDGSIIIRGKCGEEICMKGGNITLSCPGNIEIRPGKSSVTLAGHDAVVKAKKSVDISATDNDVRIKAQNNLHMVSTGILLESNAVVDTQDYSKEGEEAVSSGIVLKADNARVFTQGKIVHTAFKDVGIIEAIKQQDNAALRIVAPKLQAYVNSAIIKTENTALQLSNNQAALIGNSAYVSGTSFAGVFHGSKYLVPMQEAPVGLNPHAVIMTDLNKKASEFGTEASLGTSYSLINRAKIKFTFRSSDQYGTNTATEVFGADKFVVYETSWSFLKKLTDTPFITGEIDEWAEVDINGTYPWPGKDCYDNDSLVELTTEENMDGDRIKSYKELLPKSNGLQLTSMNTLTVMKT